MNNNDSLDWLIDFLENVCSIELENAPSEQLNHACEILKNRYSTGYRHEYSKLSRRLRDEPFINYSSDQFDTARRNFRYILKNLDEQEFNDCHKKSVGKLFDHLELEFDRVINIDRKFELVYDSMEKLRGALQLIENGGSNIEHLTAQLFETTQSSRQAFEIAKEATERATDAAAKANDAVTKANDAATKANDAATKADDAVTKADDAATKANDAATKANDAATKADDAAEQIKGFNNQSITILSIFTAVVFSFTGGFTMLGSAFSNILGITRNESILLITLVLIVGCVLFDTIYFLLYFASRISGVNNYKWPKECSSCTKKPAVKPSEIKGRFAWVIWGNLLIIAVVVYLFVMNHLYVTPSFPQEKNIPNIPVATEVPTESPMQTDPLATSTLSPSSGIEPLPSAINHAPKP